MKFLLDAQLPKKLSLFSKNLDQLILCLKENRFVELTFENMIIHG